MTRDAAHAAPGDRGSAARPRPRSGRARAGSSSRLLGSSRSRCVVGQRSSLGRRRVNGSTPALYDAAGRSLDLPRRAVRAPTSRTSSPAGGPTRSCCPPSGCSAGSRLLLMQRLPQDLVTPDVLRRRARPRPRSSSSGCSSRSPSRRRSAIVVRSDSWLRRYKYTWAAAGVGAAAADVRVRHGRQRAAPDPRRSARSAASRPSCSRSSSSCSWPATCRRTGRCSSSRTRASGRSACRRCRTSRRWSRCGRSPSAIVVVQRDLGAALLFFARVPARCSTSRPAGSAYVVVGLVAVLRRQRASWPTLFDHVRTAGRHLARPVRRPARRRLPDRPGAARVRPRRAARRRARRRAADDRRAAADPRGPHRLPARGARRGARPRSACSRSSACTSWSSSAGCGSAPRRADDFRSLLAAGPRAGHRRPGVHHRGGQPQGHAADRGHAAVHQLRRLVAARQRARRRAAARPVRPGRRAAAAAARGATLAARCSGGRAA